MNDLLNNKNKQAHEEVLERAVKKQEKSAIGFFVRRYKITYLVLGLIFLLGIVSLFVMPKEAEPEIKIPYATITTVYPGANPVDIEETVTDKIEEKIKNLDKLKQFSSTSKVGYSSIFIEFEAEADLKDSFQKLRDAVDEAKPGLPDEADDPYVREINFNDFPIVTYSFVGDYSDQELKDYADILQTEFESIKDVSKVPIIGAIEREFQIIASQTELAKYGISMSQAVSAISSSNFNLPAGDIAIDDYNYTVRVEGKFKSINELEDVVVAYYDQTPVYVKDIGQIVDSYKEKSNISKIGLGHDVSKNTISLQIYKKTGGNILNIVENAEKVIADLEARHVFPDDLKILKTNDNSQFIKDDIHRLGYSGLQTMILIIVLLFAVLGLRGAVITGFSVPIAFFIAFIAIWIQGMTINSMVLFAMVLSLGLMVDNSIIVMEGITEYVHRYNKSPYKATLLSIWNYKWPIIAGTMTTVGAFLPMLLVSGIMGEYIGILPKTLSATLIASLFVALIIIPALNARFYKKVQARKEGKKHRFEHVREKIEWLKVHYVKLLRKVLPSKKKRRRIIWSAILLLIITIALPITGIMKIEMFPAIDFDYFIINIELPVGTTLEKTEQVTAEIEELVAQIPEIDNYVSSIGSGYSIYAGLGSGSGEHLSSIIVNLVDPDLRERKSYEISEELRLQLAQIQGAEISLQDLTAGPPTGAPVEIKISGNDLTALAMIAEDVQQELKNISGIMNISDSLDESSGEFTFSIDREKAQYYGLSVASVAGAIRQALFGVQASVVNLDGDDIDITIKYSDSEFGSADDLGRILIMNPQGQPVRVDQVADLRLEPSVLGIGHVDGEKVVSVTADYDKDADIRSVMADVERILAELDLPDSYSFEIGGETDDIEQSYTEMFMSMILAVFVIMFILVLQFDSYKQPFIIIFALPLAVVGAFVGLTVLRLPFSLPAFIGLVSLAGIVVNDSIVLIDRINKNMKRGMDFVDGIIEAGIARMQPIFLTSVTTIAGILPLALSEEMWLGLGFTIIFGLIFSTVLTLIFIPVLYAGLCKKDFEKGRLT